MSSTTTNIKPRTVNVRTLAEFALEHGDLNPQMMLADRMQDGIRGHKLLQDAYPEGYRREVSIRLETSMDGMDLIVQGRMDGVCMTEQPPLVDEIKTTQRNPHQIEPTDYPEHWAQAEIYAHMLCVKHHLQLVRVRLSYYNLSGTLAKFERTHTAEHLCELFESYTLPYVRWLKALDAWRERSLPTIRALPFPFDRFRAGQREMAANGYIAVRDEKNLLCQAPTGIGKTAGALFPAIKSLGEGKITSIFYLTARTTTRQIAESTLQRMRDLGLILRSVTLTAKEKLCLHPGERCSPETCDRARGYFDRRRGALIEALQIERLTRQDIEALSLAHCLCPFEFSLDLSEIADVIICDYNHAFDPKVKLKRYFMDGGDYALLVDEAHNLIDRSREMLSASLSQRDFEELRRDIGKAIGRKGSLYKSVINIINAFKALREEHDEDVMELEPPESLHAPLVAFTEQAQSLINDPVPVSPTLIDAYFAALTYLRVEDSFDEHYRVLWMPQGKAVLIKLWCFDASTYLRSCMNSVRATILFSATLSPMQYYADALGLCEKEGDAMLDLPSPFPPENLLVAGLPIPTKYRMREQSAPEVAKAIVQMCLAKSGNYLACFPSHAYLNRVRELLEPIQSIRLITQRTGMDDFERAEFLAQFELSPEKSMLAMVAMGGIFTEGIDLPGELLSGAAIVGVGIPQIGFEREMIRELYDDGEGMGYRYAYTYPGLERVLQAAGRVIRTDEDRGVVLLIDDRFGQGDYKALLPPHWRIKHFRFAGDLVPVLRRFWAGNLW